MSTLQDYEVIASIGCGSYGDCKQIRRKSDNKILVWKEIDYALMTDPEKKMLTAEVNLLRKLKHPFIVRYYGHILDKSNTMLYIIMEYCSGGDLQALVKKCRRQNTFLDEDYIWKILCQLTLALRECHDSKRNGQIILHRDIKPANTFLNAEKDVKLGDFGFARVLSSTSSFARTFAGTPYYMSPELVNNKEYNDKSDVWSLGCLIYELCTLVPPFTAGSQAVLYKRINEGKCRRIPPKYSDSLNDIIMKMLTVEVDERPTVKKIMQIPTLAEKYRLYELDLKGISIQDGNVKSKIMALENKISDDSMKKRLEEMAAKEKVLKERERIVKEREEQLAKNLARLEVKEKMLNEKRERMDEYISVCRHLGLQDYPPLRDHQESKRIQQIEKCSSLPLSKKCNSNTLKKQVHFQSVNCIETKPKGMHWSVQRSTKPPASYYKENVHQDDISIRPVQVITLDKFKSSLKRATNRALRLRIAEIESRMHYSPS